MEKIIAIAILVMFSAYFSATETAFTSLNRIRIKNLANDGDRKAKNVQELSERYDSLLSTILVGNNIVNIAMSSIATVLFIELNPVYGATIATAVITVVVLIFGEISPKNLAKEQPEKFAMFSAPLIRVFMVVLAPVNWIFGLWKKLLAKLFNADGVNPITEDELLTIVEEAETEGGIDEDQSELIQNAIEFNELEAWDVLTPRVDIQAIEIDESQEDIAELFRTTGFSRLPVYEDDLDNIVGVLNQKDFHNYIKGTDKSISEYVKPVIFVAGSMKIAQLLKRLQTVKTHIAIIVDEYGGTSGLVTMEDIIEELVGEIYDEHDAVATQDIVQQQDGTYRVLCGTNIDKMFDFFDVEEEIDATTVNGWVVLQIDKLAEVGDHFIYEADYKRFDVTVTKADARKSLEINMTVTELPREE
ncbi:MAG: HlyC/CorC family transporter [Firmicutes bacterium]|nr:HlyC/CorC family transporter [Bacillota bacterium]MBR1989467.1 HlyC/CorC family transporter [Bacillota bacterium]MBR3706021.1 HlyC/CorC family transporter [Bacillota bacterium]